jgi:hypothetical protein
MRGLLNTAQPRALGCAIQVDHGLWQGECGVARVPVNRGRNEIDVAHAISLSWAEQSL